MRKLIVLAIALFSTTAFAGVLPISGRYCDDGDLTSAGVIIDADGVWSEENSAFDRIIKSGPRWWQVSYKDPDGYLQGVTARVSLSWDKATLTLTDSDSTYPIILHRCPS